MSFPSSSQRKVSVNEALISEGLGAVEEVRGFRSREDCSKFVAAMKRREGGARGRGRGMWEGHQDVALWRKVFGFWRRVLSRLWRT